MTVHAKSAKGKMKKALTRTPGKEARARKKGSKAMENAKAKGAVVGAEQGTPESLEKVRDILFGAQMRESDKRFSGLEQRLQKDLAAIREENRKRLDALETYINKEIGVLTDRLKSEQADRSDADKALSSELKDAAKTLAAKIKELDERSSAAQSDLQKQILEQSKTLRDEQQQGLQDLRSSMDRVTDELSTDKADRSLLAELFTDIAVRLTAESKKASKK